MADYDRATNFFAGMPAEAWEELGLKSALAVFKETAETVPAYQEFLKLHNFSSESVKSFEDFYTIPTLDKYNYVQTYGFNEINLTQAGKNLYSYSLSSGTIDEPTIWPRYIQYEDFLPLAFDIFMRQNWQIDQKSTLAINAFAFGPWMAGVSVHHALRPLTQKYNLTMGSTGADINSIVYSITKLSKLYDQTIIFSYPTFARTILDRLIDAGVKLRKLNLKMFIAGEGHTVEWRQYINKLTTGDPENLTAIIDGYGITDTGLSGMGTALTNLIRDLALKNAEFRQDLFGKTDSVPALFQYNTGTYFIEEVNGETVITTKSTTPLVRYNVHDRGGVIKFRDMENVLKKHGYDYRKIIKKKGLPENIIVQQPFVYCFGRRDDVVIVGGANVHPEQIAPALFNDIVNDVHSFKLTIDFDKQQRQLFIVLIELKAGVTFNPKQAKKIEKKYHDIILKQLQVVNFDFSDAYRIDRRVADPIVNIFSAGTGPFAEDTKRTKPRLVVK